MSTQVVSIQKVSIQKLGELGILFPDECPHCLFVTQEDFMVLSDDAEFDKSTGALTDPGSYWCLKCDKQAREEEEAFKQSHWNT